MAEPMALPSSVNATSCTCLACGEDLSGRSTDRRNLKSGSSQHVLTLWRCTFSKKLAETGQTADPESLLGSCKMCRKCYSAYERVIKAQGIIEANMSNAINTLIPVSHDSQGESRKKRPSSASSECMQPPTKRHSAPVMVPTSSTSPDVAVHLGYKKPRTYVLTPSRKHIGKAVARGSRKAVAYESLNDPVTRKYVLAKVGSIVRSELACMCSDKTDSILRSQSASDMKHFEWDKLLSELEAHTPVLLSILQSCTQTRRPRPNRKAIVGICAAILLKHRFGKMSLIQRILSVVLYAGHAGKQVYQRLQKLNVTMSHPVTSHLLNTLGVEHDAVVKEWRDNLIERPCSENELPLSNCGGLGAAACRIFAEDLESSSGSSDSDLESDSDSDSDSSSVSAPPYSPITSDDSDPSLSESESDMSSTTDEEPTLTIATEKEDTHDTLGLPQRNTSQLGYKVVGDNIDKSVRARCMRSEGHRNKSLHYFHSFAIQDRVDFSHLPDSFPSSCANSAKKIAIGLLPDADDDKALHESFTTHISRILVTNIPYFKFTFGDVVQWHIPHEFSEEMSTRSVIVPLGVLLKNENKGDEMVEIMSHLHQYVPSFEYTRKVFLPSSNETTEVPEAVFHTILFGGDQLTAARARGSKRMMINASSRVKRLEGMIPVAEDWHTKLNPLDVVWKYYYSKHSVRECGTMYQLRNVINRTNVVTKPADNFNACDDFFQLIITCHALVASLKALHMDSLDSVPSQSILPDAENVWMKTKDERKKILAQVISKVVDRYTFFRFNECGRVVGNDQVFEYSTQLLGLGLFYLEFADAIKEGDGNRVLRCWRFLLPIFKSSGRKNYAIETLNMLCQYNHGLPPRQAAQLLWNRFVNVHGLPGRNIPADLHQEHLNRVVKEAIRGLGANKTERAIARVGKALGTVSPVLDQFDNDNGVQHYSGQRHIAGTDKDRDLIIGQLQHAQVFTSIAGRKHTTFPKPRDVLHAKQRDEIVSWMQERI